MWEMIRFPYICNHNILKMGVAQTVLTNYVCKEGVFFNNWCSEQGTVISPKFFFTIAHKFYGVNFME